MIEVLFAIIHDGDTNERIFKQNIYYRVSECAE